MHALSHDEQNTWSRRVSINSNSDVVHPLVHAHPISGRKSLFLHLGMTGAVLEMAPGLESWSPVQTLSTVQQFAGGLSSLVEKQGLRILHRTTGDPIATCYQFLCVNQSRLNQSVDSVRYQTFQ